jgi:hypothetical protein
MMANPLLGLDDDDAFQKLNGNPLFAAQKPGGVAGSLFQEGKSLADATPAEAKNWGFEIAKTPVGGGPTQGRPPGNQPLGGLLEQLMAGRRMPMGRRPMAASGFTVAGY